MDPLIITKLELYAAAAVAVLAIAAGLYIHEKLLYSDLDAARADAKSAHASLDVANSQAKVTTSAAAVTDKTATAAAQTLNIHLDNAHAISAAPGASVALDPALNTVGRHSVCLYDAYRNDPGCAQLRQGNPGQLPHAGGADPTTGH